MKIITLNNQAFDKACQDLATKVTSGGFIPDTVIGIARGGDDVAEALCRHIHPAPRRLSITLQRPTTKAKAGLTTKLLHHLPRPICDFLRIAESRLLALTDRFRTSNLPDAQLPPALKEALEAAGTNILIADDAVDSGKTLKAVKEAIEKRAPKATIKTAVITVTRPNPVLQPDYTRFPIKTIVRFPWAPDA